MQQVFKKLTRTLKNEAYSERAPPKRSHGELARPKAERLNSWDSIIKAVGDLDVL